VINATTTDWITAIASVFAAIGTVGAVIVALWQVLRQDKRRLEVRCGSNVRVRQAVTIPTLVAIRTNVGRKTIQIQRVQTCFADGSRGPMPVLHGTFPTLEEGDSDTLEWDFDQLVQIEEAQDQPIVAIQFTDTFGNRYFGNYPGVRRWLKLPWLPQRYSFRPELRPDQLLKNL
jgi:hypothetical protein